MPGKAQSRTGLQLRALQQRQPAGLPVVPAEQGGYGMPQRVSHGDEDQVAVQG